MMIKKIYIIIIVVTGFLFAGICYYKIFFIPPKHPVEASARSALKSIHVAEKMFQLETIVDADSNKIGEYGTLGELTGAYLRSGKAVKNAFISQSFSPKVQSKQGYLGKKSGYYYQIFLPGLNEVTTDARKKSASKNLDVSDCEFQEKRFRVYAWPVDKSGKFTFVIDQNGETLCVKNAYYGLEKMPSYNSAVSQKTKDSSKFQGLLQQGEKAMDGNVWFEY